MNLMLGSKELTWLVNSSISRPQNLRDVLVRASISKKSKTIETGPPRPPARNLYFPHHDTEHKPKKQVNITDFFKSKDLRTSLITNSASMGDVKYFITSQTYVSLTEVRHIPNLIKNACKTKICRYCHSLDCGGKITCMTGVTTYNCKRNFTCSNLVYAISCITCMWDKLKEPFLSIFKGTMPTQIKPIGI